MNGAASVPIVALVTHARQVPAIDRERFVTALRHDLAGGTLVLETCHRVEAYVASEDQAATLESLLPEGGRALNGEGAVRHAMSVAVGRDSVVVGEDQVLHQLRTSVDAARAAGVLDPVVERLFAVALQAGRRARSWRQGPPRSLADVAVAAIERAAGSVRGREVLVVGAGRMGRRAARAAVAAGASVAVASRSANRAEVLAAEVGARVEAFAPHARIGRFSGVVVGLTGSWPIGATAIDALARSSAVVVDLSVPAAVPARLGELLGARLVTADDLARSVDSPAANDDAATRLDALVDRSTAEFVAWHRGHLGRTVAEALVDRADREREAELAALWRRLPELDIEARDAIEAMTQHLAKRLLREPLERLGRDRDGHDGGAIRDIFAL